MESSLKTESPSQRLTTLPAPFGKGAFWAHGFQSLAKIKRLCPRKETKAQTSAVPLFLPGQHTLATQDKPGNGGVRRGLLWFSPQLQGDLRRSLPSASHQTAALCTSWGRVLVLFLAFQMCILILSGFGWNVKGRGSTVLKESSGKFNLFSGGNVVYWGR